MGGYRIANSYFYVDLATLRNPAWILELKKKDDSDLLALFALRAVSFCSWSLPKKEAYRIFTANEYESKNDTRQRIERFTNMGFIYPNKERIFSRPKLVRNIYESLEDKINHKKIKFEIKKNKIRNNLSRKTFCISMNLYCYPEQSYHAFVELCPSWKLPATEQEKFSTMVEELFA